MDLPLPYFIYKRQIRKRCGDLSEKELDLCFVFDTVLNHTPDHDALTVGRGCQLYKTPIMIGYALSRDEYKVNPDFGIQSRN